ncbi:MAG: hypothetical protein GX593_10050 [Actinomycetales bacterium]|nr:hypothetical protein [Actinomycetales bacterium]
MAPEITFDAEGLPWLNLPGVYPTEDLPHTTEAARRALWHFKERDGEDSLAKSWGMKLASRLDKESQGQHSGMFLWLTEPLVPHALVFVEIHPAQGDAASTLPLLGGAPDGEPFSVPGLGDGARYRSTAQVRSGLFGKATRHVVRWVWRVEDLDLIVTLEREDAQSLARLLPDVETLLAAATVTRAA